MTLAAIVRRVALIAILAVASGPTFAQSQPAARGWQREKCATYAALWSEALARFGRHGLGEAFLAGHDAFIAAGCEGRRAVCPRTQAEVAIADALTIAAMNARMASSFVPFVCRD